MLQSDLMLASIGPHKPRNSRKNRCDLMKIFSKILIFFSALCSLSACAEKPPKPPVSFPFAIAQKGAKVDTIIRIPKAGGYYFTIEFIFKENDPLDRERLMKLAGDSGYKDGHLIEDPEAPGIPLLLKLRVVELKESGEKLVFEKITSQHPRAAYGMTGVDKEIAVIPLNKGRYRVSLESLRDTAELQNTNTEFSVHKGWSK